MYKNKRILGIIPARAGSRGLPGKNIMKLAGKPLIAWTIEQARASNYLDKVVVSTDSRGIARISRAYGAETPFIRPKALATSSARVYDVIRHALAHFRSRGIDFDLVVLLQTTSPLRDPADIDNAIRLLLRKKGDSVISVSLCEHHPLLATVLTAGGFLGNIPKLKRSNKNRQELPVFYRPNGAVYATSIERLLKNGGFVCPKTVAYIMPAERSVDIDTRLDFELAALLMKGR
ncbi:MAG: acylneuraminate cytidylyltransferase family protein, partial [Candidatus Omnitrophota bacterium]